MTDQQLREYLGIGIVVAHVGVILFLLTLRATCGNCFADSELDDTLAIVSPMLAAHVPWIIKHSMRDRHRAKRRRAQPFVLSFTAFLFLIALVGVIVGATLAKFWFNTISFGDYKVTLGIAEAFVGIHLGYIVSVLYEEAKAMT